MPADKLAFGEDAPLFDVMRTMRAMRRLKPDPVPREMLERIVEAGTWAPSGGNIQQYAFVVVDDREQIARLAPLWQRIQRMYVATLGQIPRDTMDAAQRQRLLDTLAFQAEHFAETPALIVACYSTRSFVAALVKRGPEFVRAVTEHLGARGTASYLRNAPRFGAMSEAASTYPAVQNMLLAARALGLGATLTTWHLALEGEFKAILGIPGDVKTFALLPVGYPRGNFGPVRRRPVADVLHWNRFGS
jgi:nitroreductase